VCEAYGVSPEDTIGHGMPRAITYDARELLPDWLLERSNSFGGADVEKAATINDNDNLTWAEKEAELIPLFKKHGIRLVFEGHR
jgi:hypothetical protein